MSIFRTKRIIAIVIFLAMILTNVAASAGTVTVQVTVDQDAAKNILTGMMGTFMSNMSGAAVNESGGVP